jgi:hypothetical protein
MNSKTIATKVAIMTAVAGGAVLLGYAAEARTHHHYRGVPATHRGVFGYGPPPVYAYPAPTYAYPPVGRTGVTRYRNDRQLYGHAGG